MVAKLKKVPKMAFKSFFKWRLVTHTYVQQLDNLSRKKHVSMICWGQKNLWYWYWTRSRFTRTRKSGKIVFLPFIAAAMTTLRHHRRPQNNWKINLVVKYIVLVDTFTFCIFMANFLLLLTQDIQALVPCMVVHGRRMFCTATWPWSGSWGRSRICTRGNGRGPRAHTSCPQRTGSRLC